MENEELKQRLVKQAALAELQHRYITFATAQFAELFALIETVLDVQRMVLIGQRNDPLAVTAQVQAILDRHREKHAKLVKGFEDCLADKPEGSPS